MLHTPFRIWLALLMALALLFGSGGARAQEADPTTDGPLSEGSAALNPGLSPAAVSVQAAGGGFLYALVDVNGSPNQIYGYQVNELTGALTPLPGFPLNTGGNGSGSTLSEQMAYDAANSRLYVLNDGSDTLSAYSVNRSTGALTPLPFSPISLGAGDWYCLAVHPSGSPLVAGDSTGNLASFNITSNTASPAAGSPFGTGGAEPFSCALSRDGNYVYTGGNFGTAFAGFSVNATTGVLTPLPGSPFNSGNSNPAAYALDNAGRLFMTNALAGQLRVFTTGGGVPSPVAGNPFPSGLSVGVHGVLHPAGYYLVADRSGNQVGVYRINGSGSGTTLTPAPGSPFASGGSLTNILALNQSGAFVFAANGDSRNLTRFAFDAATGALSSPVTQPANTLGATGRITGLAYVGQPQPASPPGSGFVYTLEDKAGSPNQLYGFSVNELTGALTPLPGFPLNTGGNGSGSTLSEQMAYDAANSRLYVLNDGSDTLSAYSVNRSTGALTPLPFSPISLGAGDWYCLAVHPSGSPLVAGDSTGNLASFNITSNTASPAAGSPFGTGGAEPFSCALSRDGNYVYTGGNFGTAFAGFSVNATTGVLTPLPGSPFNSGNSNPAAYALDNAGRLFMTNALAGQLRVFTTGGGVPSPVAGNPFPSGLSVGVHGVLHPAGYYLVADRSGNQVGVYRINGSGSGTTLTAAPGSPFASGGSLTNILALNRAGTFLFAANGNSRNVTTYAVEAASGALNGASIQPINSAGSTGIITGLAYVPGLNYLFLPLVQR
jgi:6-phosphogluconolactonase (cycloisomerase 2 family)